MFLCYFDGFFLLLNGLQITLECDIQLMTDAKYPGHNLLISLILKYDDTWNHQKNCLKHTEDYNLIAYIYLSVSVYLLSIYSSSIYALT